MLFLIIFLIFLGVLGGCIFSLGRLIGKDLMPFTILNIGISFFSMFLLFSKIFNKYLIINYLKVWFIKSSLEITLEIIQDDFPFFMNFLVTFTALFLLVSFVLFFLTLGFLGGCFFGDIIGKSVRFFTFLELFLYFFYGILLLIMMFFENSIIVTYLKFVHQPLVILEAKLPISFIITFIFFCVHISADDYPKLDLYLTRLLSYVPLLTLFILSFF